MDSKINALWAQAEKEGIEVRYTDLHSVDPDLNGLYVGLEEFSVILLDNSLKTKRQLFRCVFAEEMGHYYTVAKSNLLVLYPGYSEDLKLSREEYRAICWATNYLIPDYELFHAAHNLKITSAFKLAEYFDVTCGFLMQKLTILKRKKNIKMHYPDPGSFDWTFEIKPYAPPENGPLRRLTYVNSR